ncbi:DNA polymerase epsilon catalytic subunit [Kappamyces sp. JEL0680]|nr:DNA polymerase epsilon catalytic subunit [Kappamyces sp. JEL0680]
MGFESFVEGDAKLGWLVNVHETLVDDGSCPEGHSGLDLYFLQDDGSSFKATILYQSYFYLLCQPGFESDVEDYCRRKFAKQLASLSLVEKEDLTLANHLTGKKLKALRLAFFNNDSFKSVRNALSPIVDRNSKSKEAASTALDGFFERQEYASLAAAGVKKLGVDAQEYILELREHDIAYYSRVMIDQGLRRRLMVDIRVGLWYNVMPKKGVIYLEPREDIVHRADPVVLAFDIETTKLPLRFPDSAFDSIIMISYMIDGQVRAGGLRRDSSSPTAKLCLKTLTTLTTPPSPSTRAPFPSSTRRTR